MNGKQMYSKLVLILVAEALAVVLTNAVSQYIVPVHHTTLSYIVCGAALAYIVVYLYDYIKEKRKERIRRELRDITDAALMRYNVSDRDQQQ